MRRARDELTEALRLFSRARTLLLRSAGVAWPSRFAICSLDEEPKMLEHLQRAIDLAVRYDYEYWLKRR